MNKRALKAVVSGAFGGLRVYCARRPFVKQRSRCMHLKPYGFLLLALCLGGCAAAVPKVSDAAARTTQQDTFVRVLLQRDGIVYVERPHRAQLLDAIPDEELANARRSLVAVDASGKLTPLGLSDGQGVLLTKPGSFALLSDAEYVREDLQQLVRLGTSLRLRMRGSGATTRTVKVAEVGERRLGGTAPSNSYEFAVDDGKGNTRLNVQLSDVEAIDSDDAATRALVQQLVARSAKDARAQLRDLLAAAPSGTVAVGYLHRVPAPQFRSDGRIRKDGATYTDYVQIHNTMRDDWRPSAKVFVEGPGFGGSCAVQQDGPLCTLRLVEPQTGVARHLLGGLTLSAGQGRFIVLAENVPAAELPLFDSTTVDAVAPSRLLCRTGRKSLQEQTVWRSEYSVTLGTNNICSASRKTPGDDCVAFPEAGGETHEAMRARSQEKSERVLEGLSALLRQDELPVLSALETTVWQQEVQYEHAAPGQAFALRLKNVGIPLDEGREPADRWKPLCASGPTGVVTLVAQGETGAAHLSGKTAKTKRTLYDWTEDLSRLAAAQAKGSDAERRLRAAAQIAKEVRSTSRPSEPVDAEPYDENNEDDSRADAKRRAELHRKEMERFRRANAAYLAKKKGWVAKLNALLAPWATP